MSKAIEIASNLETAEKNTHVMKSNRPSVADHPPCRHCGKKAIVPPDVDLKMLCVTLVEKGDTFHLLAI